LTDVTVNFTVYVPFGRGWVSKMDVRGSEVTEFPIPYRVEEDEMSGCNVICSGVYSDGELLEVSYKDSLSVIHRVVGIVDGKVEGGWREIGSFEHTKDLFPLMQKLNADIGRRE
jgi:hypothetical protein